MAQLVNTPRSETLLRLEARKSFSFALRIADGNGRPFDLTGAALELSVRRRRDPKNLITNSTAVIGGAASAGYARFNLQASDLDLSEGEYPFAITLLDEGYSSVLVRGTLEIVENPADLGVSGKYEGGVAASALELTLQGQTIVVQTGLVRPPGETAFTDRDREKLDQLDAAAEPNVHADWNAGPGTEAYIKNRPLTRLVPKPRTAGMTLMSTGPTDASFRWAEPDGEGSLNLVDFYQDPVFTGEVQGVTKDHVGLGNVDNTADLDKPVSVEQQKADRFVADAASHRAWIGANYYVPGRTKGPDYFKDTLTLEKEMRTTFDSVSWYRALGPNTAADYRIEVGQELRERPDRKIMYALEIWKTNPDFLTEFNSRGAVYTQLVELFTAIKETGHMERVYLAPLHEGNGTGGYPWRMLDEERGNSPAQYKQCFIKIVQLARSMGITCKFIQWFLMVNGADFSLTYVGDDHVDIIGVSYYNRSKAVGYGDTWTPPGAALREFVRKFERLSRRPVWICECGCAKSNEYGDKGEWMADLVRLVSSQEIPRIEALIFFMVESTSTDMRLESWQQKSKVGRAINDARRGPVARNTARVSPNILPRSIAFPDKVTDWVAVSETGFPLPTRGLRAASPDWLPSHIGSLRGAKVATPVGSPDTSMALQYDAKFADIDYVPGKAYVMTFDARGSYEYFKLGVGIQARGGNLFAGHRSIALSMQWESYTVPFASTSTGEDWRFPYLMFGDNPANCWFEITNIKLEPGHYPTPHVEAAQIPRTRTIPYGDALVWDCNSADTWDITVASDTEISPPSGTAHDGQEVLLRIRQPAGGGKVLTVPSNPRLWNTNGSVPRVFAEGEYAVSTLKFRYMAWADRWSIVEIVRHNL